MPARASQLQPLPEAVDTTLPLADAWRTVNPEPRSNLHRRSAAVYSGGHQEGCKLFRYGRYGLPREGRVSRMSGACRASIKLRRKQTVNAFDDREVLSSDGLGHVNQ